MSKVAALISYIFHPLLMTTLLFVVLFGIDAYGVLPYANAFLQITFVIFLVTFVIPGISIAFMVLTRSISSFKLEDRRERIMPFAFITIFYGVATWMFFYKLSVAGYMSLILLTITALILLLTLVTLFWKISAHATSIGGVLGFFSAIYIQDPRQKVLLAIAGAVVVAGMVLSSRLQLNAHTPRQLYVGLIMGFIFSFASLMIFS